MTEEEKLRVLIPHWIEHNAEHADEFSRWADRAGVAAADIRSAAELLRRANDALMAAWDKLADTAEASN